MKIIKVVHANSPQEIEAEKISLALQDYSVDTFLEKYGEKVYTYGNTMAALKSMYSMIPVLNVAANTLGIKLAVKSIVNFTVPLLLEDLHSRLNNIEFLSLESALKKYPKTYNLSIGTYTLHPRNTEILTPLEHFHKKLALDKDNELIFLLGKMGAKTVTISEKSLQKNMGSGHAEAKNIAVGVGGNFNLSQEIEQGLDIKASFSGKVGNIDPDLLTKSIWYYNDFQMAQILESRLSDSPLLRYELRNTYSETFDFNFDLAAKYLVVNFDLQAEFNSISKKERVFIVDFE